jgi:hypothetical protein
MADKTTLINVKQKMLNDLRKSLQVVNDIDVEKCVNLFFEKNWYEENKPYQKNLASCIQYIAIRKSQNK